VFQTQIGRASPPLPRIGRQLDNDDDGTSTGRSTSRVKRLPRVGVSHLQRGVNRRAPLPRLGFRHPGARRSLPLPRVGRYERDLADHWNPNSKYSESLPGAAASKDWGVVVDKRPVPLPRMG